MTGFPREARLCRPTQFQAVLKSGRRVSDRLLTVAFINSPAQAPRMGLAISKRAVPKAVGRNRVKRQIRESFRQHRAQLPAIDIVVLARSAAADAGPEALRRTLTSLWDQTRKACKRS